MGNVFLCDLRVALPDVGTVVHVESRGWLVGIRWARTAREGGASYYQRICRGNQLKVRMHVQMASFAREIFRLSGLYRK